MSIVNDTTTTTDYQSLDGTPTVTNTDPSASVLADMFPATEEREPVSEPEDNEVTYFVTIEPSQVEMFLIVSDTNIREKDVLSAR